MIKGILAIGMIAVTGVASFGQQVSVTPPAAFMEEAPKEEIKTELRQFTAVEKSGKVYVNWTVTDTDGNCLYVVERSADGVNYQQVDVKEGAPSPGNAPLLFCIADAKPLPNKSFYRVTRISNGSSTFSAVATVTNKHKPLFTTALIGK